MFENAVASPDVILRSQYDDEGSQIWSLHQPFILNEY